MTKAKSVLGKDFMIFVEGKTIALSTSCKMSVSAETIETRSKDSGIWTEKEVKGLSWSGSSENVYSADSNVSAQSVYDNLFKMMLERKAVAMAFGIPENADSEELPDSGWKAPLIPYAGKALITSLELNAPDGDKASFSVNFDGTGALKKGESAGGEG